jgi:predicted outer membrane repeat protein
MGERRARGAFALLAAFAVVTGGALVAVTAGPAVAAATFTVDDNTTELVPVGVAADCTDVTLNNCSLRDAVTAANSAGGDDTINFNLVTPTSIALTTPVSVTGNVTVDGPGLPTDLILNGGSISGIFSVTGATTHLTARDLGIQNTAVNSAISTVGSGPLDIINMLFSAGTADEGAAIHAGNTVSVTDSTFSNNTAASNGGAISVGTSALTITNSDFTNNHATAFQGGAIKANGTVTINGDSDFTSNIAATGGGALSLAQPLTINGTSDFNDNSATSGSGGAIETGNSVLIQGGADFSGNDAGGSGSKGGCIDSGSSVTVTNGLGASVFTDNSAPGGGGCISGTTVTVTGATFTANHTTSNGGAITSTTSTSVTNTTFGGPTLVDHNTAAFSGGAIYAPTGAVTSTTSTFQLNQARDGGAIAVELASPAAGGLTATGSTFLNNTTTENGGAISIKNASLTVSGSTFESNAATLTGGAIAVKTGAAGTVTNSTFSANDSPAGAAVHQNGGAGFVRLEQVTAVANTPDAGSGTFQQVSGDLRLKHTIVAGSTGGVNCLAASTISNDGYNLESITGNAGSCPSGGTNLADADPMLGPLALNGGATKNYLPAVGSPVLNQIPAATICAVTTDQRAKPRPTVLGGPACDIGSVEAQPPAPPTGVSAGPSNASANVAYTPPLDHGDDPTITSYTATCTPAAGAVRMAVGTVSPIHVLLTNGVTYTCRVAATNGYGTGLTSAGSNVTNILQPDVQAKKRSSVLYSDLNAYNTVATVDRGVVPNGVATFDVKIQNDGNIVDTINIKAAISGSNLYVVAFRDGPFPLNNMTTTGRNYMLAPGASKVITVAIRANAAAPFFTNKTVTLTGRSTSQVSKTDQVKVKAHRV